MVFFKQYGERRTGTNVLRALLAENFEQVTVLLHVLGDKHSSPSELSEDEGVVSRATWAVPAQTTSPDEPAQREYLERVAPALGAALREGQLRYLVSTKHPYAWAASWLRWSGWRTDARKPMLAAQERMLGEVLRFACLEFNRKHREWLALCDQNPATATIVRFEDLLESPRSVLAALQRQHGLKARREQLRLIRERVAATEWDHQETPVTGEPFDSDYYRRREFMSELTGKMPEIVSRSIDWTLLERLGYRP